MGQTRMCNIFCVHLPILISLSYRITVYGGYGEALQLSVQMCSFILKSVANAGVSKLHSQSLNV